ncbi:unnamed protein product [Strongylus vulgaris]|uniref:Ig-like domain-containing protein n=1 Tax=Strongylus vulgaris TaxID=40348 RepID=A0A3P7KNY5_STRVU|nr:unnamed protein product [Strongylus vulgaris]
MEDVERPSSVPLSASPSEESYSEMSTSSAAGQAPNFVLKMPPQIYTKVNENIQMKCVFSGQPLPAVTWEKDGNLVDLNRYIIVLLERISVLRMCWYTITNTSSELRQMIAN